MIQPHSHKSGSMLERPGSPKIPLIRLAHPMAFAGFLDHVGAPTNRLFRRNGLPVYCDDPTAFVPLRQAWSLFDDAARCEDQMLGWEIGKFYGDGRLSGGLLSRIEHAPTLYQGLRRLSRLVSSEASHLELGVVEGHDHILFTTQYTELKDWSGYASSQSYQIEVYVDLIRQYLGRDWMPTEIGIELERVPRIAQEHFPGTRIRPRQRMG